jgi:hypothetical protein
MMVCVRSLPWVRPGAWAGRALLRVEGVLMGAFGVAEGRKDINTDYAD